MNTTGNYLKDQHIKIWTEFYVQNFVTFSYLAGLATLYYVDWRIALGTFLVFIGIASRAQK